MSVSPRSMFQRCFGWLDKSRTCKANQHSALEQQMPTGYLMWVLADGY